MPDRSAILIVENSEDDIILLTEMLRRSKLLNPVHAVNNVHDAVCYIKGDGTYTDRKRYPEPILIFIDLHLSGESGFDLLQWVKQNHQTRAYGVVVLSSSDVYAINRAYQHGADSFLVKPLNWEDLQLLITRLRGITLISTAEGHRLQYGGD
jgi:CheY-like chemotaxis protein